MPSPDEGRDEAIIDSLEFLKAGPRRWFLIKRHVPGGIEWSWVREIELAQKLPVAEVRELQRKGDLPMLPTNPPSVPALVRPVYGDPRNDPILPKTQIDPQKAEERRRRYADSVAQTEASVSHVSPEDSYRDLERRGLA